MIPSVTELGDHPRVIVALVLCLVSVQRERIGVSHTIYIHFSKAPEKNRLKNQVYDTGLKKFFCFVLQLIKILQNLFIHK